MTDRWDVNEGEVRGKVITAPERSVAPDREKVPRKGDLESSGVGGTPVISGNRVSAQRCGRAESRKNTVLPNYDADITIYTDNIMYILLRIIMYCNMLF